MRQKRLTQLIALSALSAIALYVVQGALATGANVKEFPAWFWVLDYCLWGARALIEAAVIVYLFTTKPTTRAQSVTLTLFEIALVGLITFTVGPALRAVGLGRSMVDSVTPAAFTAWSFGIAAYTSLMVGAAGYAYRVQGDATEPSVDVAELERQRDRLQREVDNLTKAAPLIQSLPQQTRARLFALADGNGVKPTEIAELLGISVNQARRGVKEAKDNDAQMSTL